ncbi:MAG: aspartate kinase [Alphaproteobacteria bacterium]|nr:aspartate kinase [Alphaproteobacteria bacterium]
MLLIVQKFGGTSVADLERIQHVARKVKHEWDNNHQVIVVVSAMAGVTNQLIELASKANPLYDNQEYDAIVSTGEQVTAGLLALILQKMDMPARSFMGWQIPMLTDDNHSHSKILDIDKKKFMASIKANDERTIAICAGFQGVTAGGRISTLGRGGSDTSAVAIAAAIDADRCDIYTDVNGVYTTDPNIVSKARKIDKISYDEMLEMASLGAKVLQTRSVELARHYNVKLRVLSSFEQEVIENSGTQIMKEVSIMEERSVTGITCSQDETKITILGIDNIAGAARIFTLLSDKKIIVDMIVQVESRNQGLGNLTFTVKNDDSAKVQTLLKQHQTALEFEQIVSQDGLIKVSIVGSGMRTHTGVAAILFNALKEKNVPLHAVSTSEIKVSVLIDAEYMELVMRNLHHAYGLDAS